MVQRLRESKAKAAEAGAEIDAAIRSAVRGQTFRDRGAGLGRRARVHGCPCLPRVVGAIETGARDSGCASARVGALRLVPIEHNSADRQPIETARNPTGAAIF